MIIIQLAGGLGNQMFQYALYTQLHSMGKSVKMDVISAYENDMQRMPSLEKIGVTYDIATKHEIDVLRDSLPDVYHKVKRRLCGRRMRAYFEEDKTFQSKIFDWDDMYLEGYWQSEKYFAGVKDEVKRAFDLSARQLSGKAGEYLEQIRLCNSVSLHIRRGDYLLPQNEKLFGNICTDEYYKKAITAVIQKIPDAVFYIFTTDIDWAKEELEKRDGLFSVIEATGNRAVLIDVPQDADTVQMYLMSSCKHNIMANSSFSWWAAYLNNNEEKLVIAPPRWMNDWDTDDIYCDFFVRMEES